MKTIFFLLLFSFFISNIHSVVLLFISFFLFLNYVETFIIYSLKKILNRNNNNSNNKKKCLLLIWFDRSNIEKGCFHSISFVVNFVYTQLQKWNEKFSVFNSVLLILINTTNLFYSVIDSLCFHSLSLSFNLNLSVLVYNYHVKVKFEREVETKNEEKKRIFSVH